MGRERNFMNCGEGKLDLNCGLFRFSVIYIFYL